MSESKRYDGDLHGVASLISESAESSLRSHNLVVENERIALRDAHKRFVGATRDLIECLPDDLKPVLARAILGAFEIGSKATVSESSAGSVRRDQAVSGRNSRFDKRKNDPREIAIDEIITAELNGHKPVNRFSKEASAILDGVNIRLAAQKHGQVKVDVIRRRLESRCKTLRS
jgi:hypothetical protein